MVKTVIKSRTSMRLLAIVLIGTWLPGMIAAPAIGGPLPVPLNQVVVPEPPNLFQFVKDKDAAIRLGKALFWDMQLGSDGIQSCASCHFAAGADTRLKNQLSPSLLATPPDTTFQVGTGPNYQLTGADFPFFQTNPVDRLPNDGGVITRDVNDIVSSQGVRFTQFLDVVPGSRVDLGTTIPDPVFHLNGTNIRRVEPRNAPTVINAVFNFDNFWDGRANFIFNGENPFGPADPSAGVWFNNNGTLVKQLDIRIPFASLASQAVGPPLSDFEMSFAGRIFPQVGRKMLSLIPLAIQLVHPNDSILGPLSRARFEQDGTITGAKGLNTTYPEMVRAAFQDNLWNAPGSVTITLSNNQPAEFTQMEANFALFFGLALQLYQATLVSDQTPFDRFVGGEPNALTAEQQRGMNNFFGSGKCDACHGGPEFTNASVANNLFGDAADQGAIEIVEIMAMGDGQPAIYDNGFYNIAVTRTSEDIGRGGNTPFINILTGEPIPLSYSRRAQLQAAGLLPFVSPLLPEGAPERVAVDGAFKTPGLRNVELTFPYFHNGGALTLDEVVEFYTRGGNFPDVNIENLDLDIGPIGTLIDDPVERAELVAFMKALTDERVRNGSAPFDNPELLIPNGEPEVLIRIAAKGAAGQVAPNLPTVAVNSLTTPTKQLSQLISGAKEAGATVEVSVNSGLSQPVDTSTDTAWNTNITGLRGGANTVAVTAFDVAGGVETVTATINILLPDGNLTFPADDLVNIVDALQALRMTVGLVPVTPEDIIRGDVAPFDAVAGLPIGDGVIDIADALVILRKTVGLVAFF
jgi:cytochrome c peroxidase